MPKPQPINAILPKILGQLAPSTSPDATRTSRELLEAGKTKRVADSMLESFACEHPALRRAREAAHQFICDMAGGAQPYALTLLGGSGVGKTMLAKAINKFFQGWLCDRKRDFYLDDGVWYCKGGLVDWQRAMADMFDTRDYARLASFRNDFFVVLDDIASEKSSKREWSAATLFDIYNSRQDRRWTVTTANCDLAGIEQLLDPRIASRMIRDRNVCITIPPEVQDYALRAPRSGK